MLPTTSFIVSNPTGDPAADLQQCVAALRAANWWEKAGVAEHWPLTTDEAADLLAGPGEFATDRADLESLIARGRLPAPGIGEDGAAEWLAPDVMEAVRVLTDRAQFRETPSWHDGQKWPPQVALEMARQAGALDTFLVSGPGEPQLDVTDVLLALIGCPAAPLRAAFVAKLKAMLETEHGVFIP